MSNYRTIASERLAAMMKALAHPHRLRIFRRLAQCCPAARACCAMPEARRCVGELGKDLGIAPSTVSHHLKELRQAGLLRMERRGQNIECWVDPQTLRALAGFFGHLRRPPRRAKRRAQAG